MLVLVANNRPVLGGGQPDRYNARFALTAGSVQSVRLLNFAFGAHDEAGPLDSNVPLAIRTATALLDAPGVEGLLRAQIALVADFIIIASMVPSAG